MGAAGRHHAPLTRQSFSILSIADEVDLGKVKSVCGVYYEKIPPRRYTTSEDRR